MTKATISSKGEIAIPKPILDRLDLKPGAQVALVGGESVFDDAGGTRDRETVERHSDLRCLRAA